MNDFPRRRRGDHQSDFEDETRPAELDMQSPTSVERWLHHGAAQTSAVKAVVDMLRQDVNRQGSAIERLAAEQGKIVGDVQGLRAEIRANTGTTEDTLKVSEETRNSVMDSRIRKAMGSWVIGFLAFVSAAGTAWPHLKPVVKALLQ